MSSQSQEVEFKSFTHDDIETLYSWRNNPEVAKFSGSNQFIEFEDHYSWSLNRIEQVELLGPILIFWQSSLRVGMTRLDCSRPNICEVSILVNPSFASRGIGHNMLQKTICYARIEFGHDVRIVAKIHKNNEISIKTFAKSGFVKIQNGEHFHTFELI